MTRLESGTMLPDPQECFLNEVMRMVGVPGPVESSTEQDRLKTLKNQPKGLPIATRDSVRQPIVGKTIFHRKPALCIGEKLLTKITRLTNTCNGANQRLTRFSGEATGGGSGKDGRIYCKEPAYFLSEPET